jgi:predicted RNase H-related nuclease YkuK (DUF458 family)
MMTFHSPTYGDLTFDQMVDSIVAFIANDRGTGYSLMVGSDSEMSTKTSFITAIVLHQHGHGAKYFWSEMVKPRYATLRERIWQEAIFSISVAKSIVEEMAKREVESKNIEIHVDIGENGPTKALIQEITGYVRGNGFDVHIKPDSCAASAVADRLT